MPRVVPGYKEEAKKRIMEDALRVFSEKGYRQTTMDDIARSLGVSKGALYLYFKSKEELFREICDQPSSSFASQLHGAFDGVPLVEGLVRYFDEILMPAVSRAGFHFDSLGEATRNEVVRDSLFHNHAVSLDESTKYMESLQSEGIVRKDIPARVIAMGGTALFDGMREIMAFGGDVEEAKEVWVACMRAIMGGPENRSHD